MEHLAVSREVAGIIAMPACADLLRGSRAEQSDDGEPRRRRTSLVPALAGLFRVGFGRAWLLLPEDEQRQQEEQNETNGSYGYGDEED